MKLHVIRSLAPPEGSVLLAPDTEAADNPWLARARSNLQIMYRTALAVSHTLTRSQPAGWTGYSRRIDERMLAEVLEPLGASARTYLCGPTALVENAANALVRLGLPPDRVRTERFGPSGT